MWSRAFGRILRGCRRGGHTSFKAFGTRPGESTRGLFDLALFRPLKWLIGGGGLVTALAPGVIDDWPSPSDEGEDALDYLRKWVELVETAHLTASKLFGIKMLSRFSRDEDSINYLIKIGYIPVLRAVADHSTANGSMALQKAVLEQLLILSTREAAQPHLLNDGWEGSFSAWAKSSDQAVPEKLAAIMSSTLAFDGSEVPRNILQTLDKIITNESASNLALARASTTLATIAHSSNKSMDMMEDIHIFNHLRNLVDRHESNAQVQGASARIVRSAVAHDARVIVRGGWLPVLNRWAHSTDKSLRLITAQLLDSLMRDDEIAAGILSEYGVQLLLDVASGLDIDVQHTVEKTLEHLTREREVPKKTRKSEDCKINDKFEVV